MPRDTLFRALVAVLVAAGVIGSALLYREARSFVATTTLPIFPQQASRAEDLPQARGEFNLPVPTVVDPNDEVAVATPGEIEVGVLPPDPEAPAPPPATEPMTVLLMGIDRRQNEEGPWRSDSMILLSVDPVQQRVTMISMPRDLFVTLPDYGEGEYLNRINTALLYGDFNNYPGGGPALAKETVRKNFGITVDRYLVIDFDGFRRLVDQIGGIDICVPQRLVDNEYPTEDGGYMRIRFDPGYQHMDGEEALIYSRTRKSTSDFARAERQQQVVLAIRNRVLSLDILSSLTPAGLGRILGTVEESIRTDLSIDEILALAQVARTIESDDINRLVIDTQMTNPYITDMGAEVLLPRWDLIMPALSAALDRELVVRTARGTFATPTATATPRAPRVTPTTGRVTPTPVGPRIVVWNGSSGVGLEQQLADELESAGYTAAQVGYAPRGPYPQSQIVIADRAMLPIAQAIQASLDLPNGSIIFGSTEEANADVLIIAGEELVSGVVCPTS